MFIIQNTKNDLFIYDNKTVVYNSNHAKEFETSGEAVQFINFINSTDLAFNINDWEIIRLNQSK